MILSRFTDPWTSPTSGHNQDHCWNGGTAINNLDVYPNPIRDIFNVSFVSEDTID